MGARVRLNSAGMRALLNDDGVRADLTRRMENVLQAAQADPHDETYTYESSLHIEQATTDRAAVRVRSSDPKSHVMEANYGILARALDSAGGE